MRQIMERLKFSKTRRALGLEITDFSVKAAEVVTDASSRMAVSRQGAQRLPDNSIKDGRILHMDGVAEALRSLVKRIRPRTRKVHVALPSSTVMIRFLKLPDLPDRKLRKLIEFELEHRVPLPFDSPCFDFVKMGAPEGGSALCDVMLAAAPLATIREYMNVVRKSGLAVSSIEIRPLSLLRLIERTGQTGDGGTFLMVDVGEKVSDLGLIHNGELRVARSVPISFPVSERDDSPVIRRACDELIQEIERFMIFFRYNLHFRDRSIDRILLSGDVPHLKQVMRDLAGAERITSEVSLISGDGFQIAGENPETPFPSLAVPVGLALRGIGP